MNETCRGVCIWYVFLSGLNANGGGGVFARFPKVGGEEDDDEYCYYDYVNVHDSVNLHEYVYYCDYDDVHDYGHCILLVGHFLEWSVGELVRVRVRGSVRERIRGRDID